MLVSENDTGTQTNTPTLPLAAVHHHDFSAIAALIQEEKEILSGFPVAVSYYISLFDSALKGESNGDELTYGMRGQASPRMRERIGELRILDETTHLLLDQLSRVELPDLLSAHCKEFHACVTARRELLRAIRLSPLDTENIIELLTTKSLPLPLPLREWELSQRRRLDEIGEELTHRMQPIYEAFTPQLSISIKPFIHFGIDYADLYQESCRGLIKAIRSFNPSRGAAFPSYLKTFLHNHLCDAVVDLARLIRVSPVILNQIRALREAEEALIVSNEREPTLAEVAKKLGITESAVKDLQTTASHPSSLDSPLSEEDIQGATMHEFVEDLKNEHPHLSLLKTQILEMIRTPSSPLSPRERAILIASFGLDGGEPKTSDELATAFGLTTGAGVRYIIAGAIKKLRAAL